MGQAGRMPPEGSAIHAPKVTRQASEALLRCRGKVIRPRVAKPNGGSQAVEVTCGERSYGEGGVGSFGVLAVPPFLVHLRVAWMFTAIMYASQHLCLCASLYAII